jgi:hypothetical protein
LNTLDIFDRVQCLAVDYRYHELSELREWFADRDIELDIFLTGKGEVLPSYFYKRIDDPFPLTNSQRCYINHKAMIRAAKEAGLKNILLLEDDVVFLDGFDDLFDAAMDDLHELGLNWDLLYLGSNHTWAKTEVVSSRLLRLHGGTYCCHAMAVNHTLFDTILELPMQPGPMDWHLAHQIQPDPRFKCYALWPNLAIQKPGFSTLNNCDMDYTQYWGAKGEPYKP